MLCGSSFWTRGADALRGCIADSQGFITTNFLSQHTRARAALAASVDPSVAAGEPTALLELSHAAPSPSTPFDPAAPPLRISATARALANWTVAPSNPTSAAAPPQSPVSCASPDACSAPVTITLVPFGSTQTRVAAFPWIDAAEPPAAAAPKARSRA